MCVGRPLDRFIQARRYRVPLGKFRAREQQFPNAMAVLESPRELVLDEFSGEVLEADRGSERAVFPDSPMDVRRIGLELRLADHDGALDIQRDEGLLALLTRRDSEPSPLAVIGSTTVTGIATPELQQEQQVDDRRGV